MGVDRKYVRVLRGLMLSNNVLLRYLAAASSSLRKILSNSGGLWRVLNQCRIQPAPKVLERGSGICFNHVSCHH